MFQRLSLTLSLLALTALTAQECCDMCGPETIVISAQHRFGRGVGYRDGYSSLDFFFAPAEQMALGLPFFDVRGHVFDNGKWAANAGIGWRYLGPDSCWVWGANVYYDYRKSHNNNFNQVSFGLEALSSNWELRANGYIPVGMKRHSYRSSFGDFDFFGFSGNNILLNQREKRRFEQTMAGLDAEVGYHVWNNDCFDLYAGIGPYYFHGEHKHKNAAGGKARITADIGQYFTVEVSDTWDNVFHNRPQAMIALNLPFGPCAKVTRMSPDCCECPELLLERLYQPVEKQEIIVLSDYKKRFDHPEVAINPDTNLPWFVLFVNNTSTDPIGTFENPFNMLLQAQNGSSPGDIIYVFPGDGTTTGMDAGITLQDNQFFWGSGATQTLPTTRGVISILPQTANPPVITNTGVGSGDGVDLAVNNEVVGFKIFEAANNGIFGSDVGNLLIAQNDILLSRNQGVLIFGTTGPSSITALNNTLSQNGIDGFVIGAGGTTALSLDFEGNDVFLNRRNGLEIDTTQAAVVTALVKNNTIQANENNGIAYFYDDFPTSLTATIDSNTIMNNLSDGILVVPINFGQVSETAIALTVTNNTIEANDGSGVEIDYSNNTMIQALVQGNSLSNNSTLGFTLPSFEVDTTLPTNYVIDLTLTNNAISANRDSGVELEMAGDQTGATSGQVNLDMSGNDASGNLRFAGLDIFYQGASILVATLENNMFNNNGGGGVFIGPLGKVTPDLLTASLTVTANNNQMNDNFFGGFEIDYANNTLINATLDANTIDANFNSPGVFIAFDNFTGAFDPTFPVAYDISLSCTNSQVQNNPDGGVGVVLVDGASGTALANLTVNDNTFVNNNNFFEAGLASITNIENGAVNWNLNYSNNSSNGSGVFIESFKNAPTTASSDATVLVSNNTFNFTTINGIDVQLLDQFSNAQTLTMRAQILNNTINNSSDRGILLINGNGVGTAPAELFAHVEGNTMTDNSTDFEARLNQPIAPGGLLCLFLKNNTSSTTYNLKNFSSGTFRFEDAGNNTGTINTTGTITPGTCP